MDFSFDLWSHFHPASPHVQLARNILIDEMSRVVQPRMIPELRTKAKKPLYRALIAVLPYGITNEPAHRNFKS